MSILSGENVSITVTALRSKKISKKQFYHYLPREFKILHRFCMISMQKEHIYQIY